jgi:hypothetical protein
VKTAEALGPVLVGREVASDVDDFADREPERQELLEPIPGRSHAAAAAVPTRRLAGYPG